MPKTNIIPRIYGYATCLIAIVIFLLSLSPLVQSIMDIRNIEYSGQYYPTSRSFNQFKLRVLERASDKSAGTDDATLKILYEDDKRDAYNRAYVKIRGIVVVNTIMLIVSIILFISHWLWIRKIKEEVI